MSKHLGVPSAVKLVYDFYSFQYKNNFFIK